MIRNRKDQCEDIILTRSEKNLLKKINRYPHLQCEYNQVRQLCIFGLICPDISGYDEIGQAISLDTYCVTDFYAVYREYLHEKNLSVVLQSLWLPITAAIATEIAIHGIALLWPLLLQWLSSLHV